MKAYIALRAALLLWLSHRRPADASEASPLPDACPSPSGTAGSKQRMPGALPDDEGLLDFVDSGSGQRTQLYYNNKSGIAAELVHARPADATYPAAYKLYDVVYNDLSSIPIWPDGACNASNATTDSLGAALAELRDTTFGNKKGGTRPCIVALVAPDLAHLLHSGENLTWSENGTACFYANKTAGTVWRASVQLTNASDATSQLSGVILELLQLENATAINATTWLAIERRSFRFLASQKLPAPADTNAAVASLVNPPCFTVCGSARELADGGRPPRHPQPGNLTLRLLATGSDAAPTAGAGDPELGREVTVADDSAVNRATVWTLTPPSGSPLNKVYGPDQLQVIADQSTDTVFAISLANGNCSIDANGTRSKMLDRDQLPFNLSDPGWRLTGDRVPFQGQLCRRYLLRGNNSSLGLSDFEVYFAAPNGSPKFADLVGYKRRLVAGGGKSASASSVTVVLVTRIGSVADEPVDYDLTACFVEAQRRRLLMRLGVGFEQLSKVGSIQLVAETRSLVAKATGLPRLSVAQVSVSKDANAKQSQVWLTLLSSGSAAADAVAALQKAVASTDGLKLLGWRVVKLEEAAAATDPNRGGGGGPVVVHEGHSGGAMAALGFFMLLLGCGAGVVGAWCVWKRRPNMPYYVQD